MTAIVCFQPSAPQSDKKKESVSKAKPATAAKDKPSKDSTAEKDAKKSVKKKPQSPAAKSEASRPSKLITSDVRVQQPRKQHTMEIDTIDN